MEYPQKSDTYFLSLEEYTLLAKKCICKFAPNLANTLLKDNDFITDLAHDIMMADWRWNGNGNRQGYRSKCARWFICDILRKRKNDIKTISLEDEIHVYQHGGKGLTKTKRIKDLLEDKKINFNEVTEDLLKPFCLTDIQKSYLLRNINGEHPKDIAKDENVTPQYVSSTLKIAKEKMRRFYDKRNAL